MDVLSIKEIIQHGSLWIPKGMKKCNFCFIAFSIDILIRNENMISQERETKNRLK